MNPIRLFAIFFISYCLYITFWPIYDVKEFSMISHYMQAGAAKWLVFILGFIAIKDKIIKNLKIVRTSLFPILFGIAIWNITGHQSLNQAYTFDAALMTIYLFINPAIYVAALVIPYVIYTKSNTALAIIMICSLVKLWRTKWRYPMGLMITVLIYIGFNTRSALETLAGRLQIWHGYTKYLTDHGRQLLGYGPGSFQWIGPFSPVNGLYGPQNPWYMHNDYIQMLFETGILGFVIFILFLCYIIKNIKNRVPLVSYMVCMAFYSPMQVHIGKLLGLLILAEALRDIAHKHTMPYDKDNNCYTSLRRLR